MRKRQLLVPQFGLTAGSARTHLPDLAFSLSLHIAQSSDGALSLAELYPELSVEELRVAEENIDRYLSVVLRISQRIENASKALANEAPTASDRAADLANQQEHGM